MSNEITAYFKGRKGVCESVYQYDYGMVILLDGLELPVHFDAWFSGQGDENAIPVIGADNRVKIPDTIISKAGNTTLHVPTHTGENDSEVEYVVTFKVIGRARPVDDGTYEEQSAVSQALAMVRDPLNHIDAIVNEALAYSGPTLLEHETRIDQAETNIADLSSTTENNYNTLSSKLSSAEDNIESLSSRASANESEINALESRMNTFTHLTEGSTSGDAELIDGRIGADAVTYNNIGTAIRTQVSNLSTDIETQREIDEQLFGSFALGDVETGQVLFTSADVSVGDLIFYDITAYDLYTGMIEFYSSSDNRLAYYGKGSSSASENHYVGAAVIPSDFSYAKCSAKRGTTNYKLKINWLSVSKLPMLERVDRIQNDIDAQKQLAFLKYNYFTPYNLNYSNNVMTVRNVSNDSYYVQGTPSSTFAIVLGTVDLGIGDYKISGYSHDASSALFVVDADTVSVGNSYSNSGKFKITEAGTYYIRLRIASGTTINTIVAPFIESTNILSNKQISDKLLPLTKNKEFYDSFTILKNRPDQIEGFGYLSFSSGVIWNGNEVIACRAGIQHTTPSDQADWGKILFHIIDKNGNISYKFLDIDYSDMPGELRDPNLSITRSNQLILTCFTTNNAADTPTYSSVMFVLDSDLDVLSQLEGFVDEADLVFGNTIETPNGYLLKVAYSSDGEYSINIYRSTSPFTNSLSDLEFEKVAVLESGGLSTEASLGYSSNKLICLVREERANAHLFTTANLEGNSGWSNATEVTFGDEAFVLHSPVLLERYDSNHIIFGGSKQVIDSNSRSPIIGYLDVETGKVISYKKVYDSSTASGYPSIIRLDNYKYSMAYYVDQIPGTSYHYCRFDTLRLLNTAYL